MSDTSDIPSHRAAGGRRIWPLVAAGLVSLTLTGAAAGCSEAHSPPLAGSNGQGAGTTEVDAGRARTDGAEVTTTATPTTPTTAPSTTTTAPTTTVPPTTTTTAPPDPADDGILELGEAGASVSALQQRLTDLGYWLGTPDGNYGQLTRQAVMAFQKAEGLGRDGTAGPETQGRLATAGRPVSRTGGTGIEIDLSRQVLLVVQGGQVRWAFNTSTGNGEAYAGSAGGSAIAATPPGQFTIQRQIDGYREAPLGTLYRPKYFNGGIAVHGSGSIPARPASHGCARLTNAAMDLLWSSGVAEIGTPVTVY
ncbi:MAG TPA: L,D-transpeptidase family protein [Acidimicrobiales bacterium]|nr:L,D-transpeptidase family protein [Acidimicrobiales bacterium]